MRRGVRDATCDVASQEKQTGVAELSIYDAFDGRYARAFELKFAGQLMDLFGEWHGLSHVSILEW